MEEKELRKVLRAFEEDGRFASGAHWSIASGEHNLVDFELSRDGEMVVSCIAGELENVSLSEDDFRRIGGIIKEEYPDVNFDVHHEQSGGDTFARNVRNGQRQMVVIN